MAQLLMVASGAVVLWLFVRGWGRFRELIWMGVAAFLLGTAVGLLDERSFLGTVGSGASIGTAITLGFSLGRAKSETGLDRAMRGLIDEGRVRSPALLTVTNWVASATLVAGALVLPGIWVIRPELFGLAAMVAGVLLGATLLLILAMWVRVARARSGTQFRP